MSEIAWAALWFAAGAVMGGGVATLIAFDRGRARANRDWWANPELARWAMKRFIKP